MTFDKWSLKNFLTIDEIAKRLLAESKDNTAVSWPDVLSLALDGHLPLVVKISPKTYVYGEAKDGSHLTIEGIWSLVMEGERGSNARRSIDRDYRRLADLPPADRNQRWVSDQPVSRHLDRIPVSALDMGSRSAHARIRCRLRSSQQTSIAHTRHGDQRCLKSIKMLRFFR